jgi:hypothetical protein
LNRTVAASGGLGSNRAPTAFGRRLAVGVQDRAKLEIGNEHAILTEKRIARLDVSVKHAGGMDAIDAPADEL